LKKNRYDGDIGEVHLGYDKDTKSFKECKFYLVSSV